eukprot:g3610.t1
MQSLRTTTALFSALIAIAAVLFSIKSPSGSINSTSRPKYYIPNEKSDFLEHVKDAFARAGYELITNENYTENWHTMWTFHNPFWNREPSVDLPTMMQELKPHQKVNHLPGASRFTSKIELTKHLNHLHFLPRSYLLPNQYSDFLDFCNKSKDSGGYWVRKGGSHRGVKIVRPDDPSLNSSEKEVVVQQYIKPYLIDNKQWDLGIYIAITSIEPLRVYYFDNVLIRACTEDFEEDLMNAKRDSYVVSDDYLPPWGLPSLRPYYTWGMSTLNVIRAHFHAQGIDFDEIFEEMKWKVLELIKSNVKSLERSAMKYPHGQRSFYSMYRVDFILDRELKSWITEINQSPNLSSGHFPDLATMFQRIVYSLLSLAGLTPGGLHHPETNEEDLEILLHANDIDIAYSLCSSCSQNCSTSDRCVLCRKCRTPVQSAYLKVRHFITVLQLYMI